VTLQVAFLSSDPDSASARVRVLDHLPGLARRGIAGQLVALPKGPLARRKVIRGLQGQHLVVLHRRLLDPLALGLLRRSAQTLALDLDDAIWERPFRARSLRNRLRFTRLLRRVDLVTVGSAWLHEQVARRHPRVRLVRPAPPPPDREPEPDPVRRRLVWTGSRATLRYLESLGPVLAELSRGRDDLILDVVADAQPRLSGVEVRFHPWSLETEAAVIARAHVGLYPLFDDPWSRGKCAYKVLRYMSLGVPSVASPQGAGAEVLEVPKAGLVAHTPQDWLDAVGGLLDDEPRRAALAASARALSAERDGLEARTVELARALLEAAGAG
jgi:glycosyltransferase involved in cell wall biosynthesis